jgi:CRISPR-associated exonuclease Cas4
VGRCDVIEFRKGKSEGQAEEVIPVEYKSGEPKEDISDKVQLCAQVLCLEEMLNISISHGAFFYGKIRRRIQIEIDEGLRKQTEEIIASVHEIVSKKKVPAAKYSEKCRNCSLEEVCMPKAMNERKLKQYLENLYVP